MMATIVDKTMVIMMVVRVSGGRLTLRRPPEGEKPKRAMLK